MQQISSPEGGHGPRRSMRRLRKLGTRTRQCSLVTEFGVLGRKNLWQIEGFTVADVILVMGQTRQNLQYMYGENRDFDAR